MVEHCPGVAHHILGLFSRTIVYMYIPLHFKMGPWLPSSYMPSRQWNRTAYHAKVLTLGSKHFANWAIFSDPVYFLKDLCSSIYQEFSYEQGLVFRLQNPDITPSLGEDSMGIDHAALWDPGLVRGTATVLRLAWAELKSVSTLVLFCLWQTEGPLAAMHL